MKQDARHPRGHQAADKIARECLGLRTRFVHRVVGRIYDDALRPFGLGGAQLNLLVGIVLAAPVRPGELAEHLRMDKSTMSRNVRRMVERGWVEVGVDDDGRSQQLRPTRAGQRLLDQVLPAWEQAQSEAAAVLGKAITRDLHGLPVGLPSS
ncbi:MAG: MarR family winged helix-turn-helix transcriptional regulator [Myxococcota bacterium]